MKLVFFIQVKTLKERIEEEKGKDHFPVSGLKLIYAGTLLYLSGSVFLVNKYVIKQDTFI